MLVHYRGQRRWVNEVEVPQVTKGQGNAREVIAVALDVAATAAEPSRVMASLAEEIGVRSPNTLIVLPPLVANIMALPEISGSTSLVKAVRRAGRTRWARRETRDRGILQKRA